MMAPHSSHKDALYLLPHKDGVRQLYREVPVCDFCLQLGAVGYYQLPPNTMSLGYAEVGGRLVPVHDSDGQWNACQACRTLIDVDEWEELIHRVRWENREDPHVVGSIDRLRRLYGEWRKLRREWVAEADA
jgi:hypothetical protein